MHTFTIIIHNVQLVTSLPMQNQDFVLHIGKRNVLPCPSLVHKLLLLIFHFNSV